MKHISYIFQNLEVDTLIRVERLTKTYRSGKGIFDIDFDVSEGEVFGYLGPNGAGKTTTIRQLMGFTNADHGRCTIRGLDTRREAKDIQRHVGYVPGEIAFLEDMTGLGFLTLLSQMRGMKRAPRMDELVDRFELEVGERIRRMSKGMKQKVAIIAGFMHDPTVYILDEPTSGLDPLMQTTFIELILEEKRRGKTILMSSHNFAEIDRTCHRAAIIREGRLAVVEDIAKLKQAQRKVFVVSVAADADLTVLRDSGLELGSITNHQVEVVIGADYDQFAAALARCSVVGLDMVPQSLEDVFMHYYGKGGDPA